MALKQRITQTSIKQLKPEDKRLNDTELSGFHARIANTGKIKYYLYYRLHGKQVNYLLGSFPELTPTQARDLAKEKIGQIAKGEDIQQTKQAKLKQRENHHLLKLSAYLEQKYLPFLEARNPKTAKNTYDRIVNTFPHLLNQRIDKIQAWDIEKWRAQKRKQGRAASTVN